MKLLNFVFQRSFPCLVLLATLSLLCLPARAQEGKGTVVGNVVDTAGAAVPNAQIKLAPLNITAVSDGQGDYRIPDVPAGEYTVTVNYVGFAPQTAALTVTAGQTFTLNLALKVSNATEQVLVSAERPHGEAEAINETRNADNLLQVMPSEVIRSLPNANVADAIGRFPSVTLYRIEGEGVYIQVRGTEPRLTNVTVDGITIPAPEPTVRQVRLDIIPSGMVDEIQISKTLLANIDGNGIGASVNLKTKEAAERPTLNLFGDGGRTNILNGRGTYDFGGTSGKRFGATKRFGLLGDATFDYNGRGIDNIQPALDPLSTFAIPFYDSNTIREYRYYRTRYGFDGSADYRVNPATTLYAHGFYSDLKDWGDKWYYSPISKAPACSSTVAGACGAGGTGTITYPAATAASSAPKFYTSSKRPNASVGTLILGGRTVHNDSVFLYQISASRSFEIDSAGNPKADFAWVGPTQNCNYIPAQQIDLYHPHFGSCDNSKQSALLTPTNWQFKDITLPGGKNTDLSLTAQASYAKNYRSWGHSGVLEAGFKFSNAHQTQDSTEKVYDGFPSTAPLMSTLLGDFNNTDYFNGTYFGGQYGPVANMITAENYTLTNFAGNGDGQKTAADIYPNLFHTVEQVTAGYIMNAIDFGKLHVNTGLRIEATRDLTFGYTLDFFGNYNAPKGGNPAFYGGGVSNTECPNNTAPNLATAQLGNCYTFAGVSNNPGYIDLLPSVQLRYGLTQNSSLRAVYARGVARPDPYQLTPYVSEDTTAATTGSAATVTVGNPALRPEHANNYDVLYEDYLRPLGLIQAGFFFKQLNAPQVETIIPGGLALASFPPGYFSPTLAGTIAQYPTDSITQYINGQNAYLYGLELSFQQHFSYLPGVLKGLGLSANYSYTASREKGLPLRADHPTTIDQAPNTWKVSPTYDTKRFSARVGLAYDEASLFSYSYISPTYVPSADASRLGPAGPAGDIWTLTHFQVDAQASYRFYKGISAVVSGLNLNNEVFGYYEGSTAFVNQREYYKPTYSAGMRYNFEHAR